MKPFKITFDGWLRDGTRDISKFCRFRVIKEGNLEFIVDIVLSGTAAAVLRSKLETDDKAIFQEVFSKMGIRRLKERLDTGKYPQQSTTNAEEIMISSDNIPNDISSYLKKNCKHQENTPRGPICAIAHHVGKSSDNVTTQQLCDSCFLPDADFICSHLIHPASQCYRSNGQITERNIIEAFCNKGQSIENPCTMVAMCIPNERDCWELIYEITPPLKKDTSLGLEKRKRTTPYDVVLSFAGENREHAEELAQLLKDDNFDVFYDKYEEANLWGKNLFDHLSEIYRECGRYCVIFVSEHYANKQWTRHERQNAQERAFKENREYILPIRIDDAKIPGILDTTCYQDLREKSIADIYQILKKKLLNN